ncbi:MAG: hypothetical protein HC889_15505 [Synechococcaceae cyanobacterium SM1_2_3]|nr:hypothetical protein [Synechococcaceae cyanobacterium SM1_2_3]
MSFGSDNAPAPVQKPLGQDIARGSTNEQARPVPYLAGIQRVGLTFISDVFDQITQPVMQSLGKKQGISGYNYFASFAALICAGPLRGFHGLYFNGDPVYTAAQSLFAASLTVSGTTVTFTCTGEHGLTTGDTVFIGGVDQAEYNGEVTITVTAATVFTWVLLDVPSASPTAAGGYITARVQLDPIFRDVDHPDSVDILIPDFCEARLYWGTDTQTADYYLRTSGVEHPAYRGYAYMVFTRLFTGFNQTSIQNLEAVVSLSPAAAWHALTHIEDDANLAAVLADVLQHARLGTGLLDARINTAELIATGAALAAEGAGLSPLVTRMQSTKEIILALCDYFDAYPTCDAQGRFGLRLARADYEDLLELTDADFVDVPSFTADDWSEVSTETNLKFTSRASGFIGVPVLYRDPAARQAGEENNRTNVERPFITRLDVATAVASSLGRMAALPKVTGRVRVRRRGTLIDDLQPGSLFTMDFSRRDLTGLIFRVTELGLPSPAKPELEVNFKLDRSYLHTALGAPLPTSGLLAWYKADVLSGAHGAAVDLWPDSSGNGNDLVAGSTPAVLDTSGANPVVRWTGTADEYTGPNGGSIRTIVAVFAVDDDAIYSGVAGQENASPGENFYLTQHLDQVGITDDAATVLAPTPLVEGVWVWARGHSDGDSLSIQTASDTLSASAVATPNGIFFLGGTPLGSDSLFNGRIAEVMFYDAVLTAAEWAVIRAYVEGKYGL